MPTAPRRPAAPLSTALLCASLAAFGCGDEVEPPTGQESETAPGTSSEGTPGSTSAVDPSSTAGTGGPASTSANPATSTTTTTATSPMATSTDSGDAEASTEPMASTGGDPPPETGDTDEPPVQQCAAIGWATRTGRTEEAFEVTGGGDATPVVVSDFGELQDLAEGDEPRVIHVDGTLGEGFRDGSGSRLEIGSNKTIVGLRPGTELRAAILISGSSNVIVRNLVVEGPGSDDAQSWDNLNITSGATNVWIDHCEFWNGQDGNADVVRGADNVTFTWNIFGYTSDGGHNFSNLVASSDDEPESEGRLNITLMFNHFTGVAQRQPRCRFGDIHVVNNLFSRDGQSSDSGLSAGVQCRILAENNHFIEINDPIHNRDGGVIELRGENLFEGTTGDQEGYGGSAFAPPYEYSHLLVPADQVQDLLRDRVGATLEDPTACE